MTTKTPAQLLSFRQVRVARELAQNAIEHFFAVLPEMQRPHKPISPAVKRMYREFEKSAVEILRAVLDHRRPPDDALENLASALNRKIHQIRFEPELTVKQKEDRLQRRGYGLVKAGSRAVCLQAGTGQDISLIDSSPWTTDMDVIRFAANALVDYLQQAAVCGYLHKTCKLADCKKVFVGQRRSKQFCSAEHQTKFWDYDRVKQVYGTDYARRNYRIRKRSRKAKGKDQLN